MDKNLFLEAIREQSLSKMKLIPKSDLHNHAGRGGSLSYIEEKMNCKINPPTSPFDSLDEMNLWLNNHVKVHCPPGLENYLFRIEAAFVQAAVDNVQILALSYAIDEIDALGGMNNFMRKMNDLCHTYAPNTSLYPDLTLGYRPVMDEQLDEIFSYGWFNGIDIINYSNSCSMKELKQTCRKAKEYGLICKAHVGEFGDADEVLRYAEKLELDEIQHGIAAAKSPQIMSWLARHKIKLNVCPTSNVMLKNCSDYSSHPIRVLYDNGVPVTINTDDLLIFNSTLSEEYFHLYKSGLMNEYELYDICCNGLQHNYNQTCERTYCKRSEL